MREDAETFEGTVAVSQLEGYHYELVAGTGDEGPTYVLIPADDRVGRLLAASVGKRVRLVGCVQAGVSIYMCGAPLRVTAVQKASGRAR